MTDTTSQHLDEHLTLLRVPGFNLFNDNRSSLLLEHRSLVGLGD